MPPQIIMHQCMHRGPKYTPPNNNAPVYAPRSQICHRRQVPKWILNLFISRVTRYTATNDSKWWFARWSHYFASKGLIPNNSELPSNDGVYHDLGSYRPISEMVNQSLAIKASPSSYQRIMDVEYNVGTRCIIQKTNQGRVWTIAAIEVWRTQ